MRYLILYGIPILIVIGIAYLFFSTWVKKNTPGPAGYTASPKALRSASDAVRALDQILTDPTLIGSSVWKQEAHKAVNDWYNK